MIKVLTTSIAAVTLLAGANAPSSANPLGFAGSFLNADQLIEQSLPDTEATNTQGSTKFLSALRRHIVDYSTHEAPGTIVIDTRNTSLYLVLASGKAIRYGIGVAREGFAWAGVKTIERKAEWPDWIPPVEMLGRQPYLPRFMAGGPGNPLGARAMYLGGTVYRIHGTNDPSTIGKRVSSGCIRMLNDDVIDLYARVNVGTKVVVLPIHSTDVKAYAGKDRSTPATPARTAGFNTSRARGVY
jgi:lipoprotein-anchoring transpeptidase ErfK/SrfK